MSCLTFYYLKEFSGKNTGVSYHPLPGDLPNPGIEPASPALQADSLLTDPWGKQLLICISLMTNEVELMLAIQMSSFTKYLFISFSFLSSHPPFLPLSIPTSLPSTDTLYLIKKIAEKIFSFLPLRILTFIKCVFYISNERITGFSSLFC